MLKSLNICAKVRLSTEYVFPGNENVNYDYRDLISPKKDFRNDALFVPVPYQQVFRDKSEFVPNLSIMDILFNAGTEARDLLQKSLRIQS